jgi:hypothetical protein
VEHLWWVVVCNEMQGPLVLADVLALLEDDRSEARIWREGYTEWRVPEDVPEVTVRQILRELCVFLSVRDNGERTSNFG